MQHFYAPVACGKQIAVAWGHSFLCGIMKLNKFTCMFIAYIKSQMHMALAHNTVTTRNIGLDVCVTSSNIATHTNSISAGLANSYILWFHLHTRRWHACKIWMEPFQHPSTPSMFLLPPSTQKCFCLANVLGPYVPNSTSCLALRMVRCFISYFVQTFFFVHCH